MVRHKRAQQKPVSGEQLKATYAGTALLLLACFVLFFSAAAPETSPIWTLAWDTDSGYADKYQTAVPPIIEGALPKVDTLDELVTTLRQYILDKNIQDSVEVASAGEGTVFIRFMGDTLFEPNSARLKQSDLEILNFAGYAVKSVQDLVELIRVDGHVASAETPDSYASARILSGERACSVLIYLESEIGVDPYKLVQVAFGSQHPIAGNRGEIDPQKTNRVEILLGSETALLERTDNVYEKLLEYRQ